MHIKLSAPSGSDTIPDYKLLVKIPFRRRGRANRFAVQATWDDQKDRIIALMTEGKNVSAIAEILQMSPATIYRRIGATRLPTDGTLMLKGGRREKMAVALLAHLLASVERLVALAAKRKEKRLKAACCLNCASQILANETIRLELEVHKVKVDCFRQLCLFDDVRTSGRALEILEMARAQEEPDNADCRAADNVMTSAVV